MDLSILRMEACLIYVIARSQNGIESCRSPHTRLVTDSVDVLQLSIVSMREINEKKAKSSPGNEIEQIGDTASHRARLVSRRSMGFHSAGPVLITMEDKTYPCLHIKISI
jgi:hypothetical protein